MRIASLNILHGGGPRVQRIADWLLAQNADAVLIQEWRDNPPGKYLRDMLKAHQYRVDVAVRPTPRSNGILSATRRGSDPCPLTPDGPATGELLRLEMAGGVSLVNVHIPVKTDKRPFFAALTRLTKGSGDRSLLVVGDFNTGSHAHDREGSYRFVCEDDFRALSSHAGLSDLWRRQHRDRSDWSWHSGKHGFRIDHAFANGALLARFPRIACRYDHSTRCNRLTDHSALIVDLA